MGRPITKPAAKAIGFTMSKDLVDDVEAIVKEWGLTKREFHENAVRRELARLKEEVAQQKPAQQTELLLDKPHKEANPAA